MVRVCVLIGVGFTLQVQNHVLGRSRSISEHVSRGLRPPPVEPGIVPHEPLVASNIFKKFAIPLSVSPENAMLPVAVTDGTSEDFMMKVGLALESSFPVKKSYSPIADVPEVFSTFITPIYRFRGVISNRDGKIHRLYVGGVVRHEKWIFLGFHLDSAVQKALKDRLSFLIKHRWLPSILNRVSGGLAEAAKGVGRKRGTQLIENVLIDYYGGISASCYQIMGRTLNEAPQPSAKSIQTMEGETESRVTARAAFVVLPFSARVEYKDGTANDLALDEEPEIVVLFPPPHSLTGILANATEEYWDSLDASPNLAKDLRNTLKEMLGIDNPQIFERNTCPLPMLPPEGADRSFLIRNSAEDVGRPFSLYQLKSRGLSYPRELEYSTNRAYSDLENFNRVQRLIGACSNRVAPLAKISQTLRSTTPDSIVWTPPAVKGKSSQRLQEPSLLCQDNPSEGRFLVNIALAPPRRSING